MTTLKERALATHAAVAAEEAQQQRRIDNERRQARADTLNAAIGEDLFFVPDLDPTVTVPVFRVRNVLHGDVRTQTKTYDVITDGSVDLGVEKHTGYHLLVPCANNCGQRVATSLGFYLREGEPADEAFARLVETLGGYLARLDGKICLDCEWQPCPTCGHIR